MGFPGGAGDKGASPTQECKREDPLSRKWQSAPVLLPRKFHRQRSPGWQFMRAAKSQDMTEGD